LCTALQFICIINVVLIWVVRYCSTLFFHLQSMEASKLQPVNKDKERMQEASHKAHELSESFSKETERKLSEKMEVIQENKNAQLLAKQERLKEHVCFTRILLYL